MNGQYTKVREATFDVTRLITNFLDPQDHGETEYGKITKREWIEKEAERIGRSCVMIQNEKGRIALARRIRK